MHKDFQACIGPTGDVAYLFQTQLTGQHHLPETGPGQKIDLFCTSVVGLRTGMQGDGRQIQTCDAHVLHNQGIDSYAPELPDQGFRFGQLLVGQQRVDRHIHPHVVLMGKGHQRGDVVQGIAGRRPGPEFRRTDIDGIGPVQYHLTGTFQVLGRSQQLYGAGLAHPIRNGSGRYRKVSPDRRNSSASWRTADWHGPSNALPADGKGRCPDSSGTAGRGRCPS